MTVIFNTLQNDRPLPWKAARSPSIINGNENLYELHWSKDGECVAEVIHGEQDAKFIEHACNMHHELVNALANLYHVAAYNTPPEAIEAANKALKKAQGGQP